MGHIFAFMTATVVRHTGNGSDDYAEEHGWIDPQWSRTELLESRNDIRPVVDCDESDDDLADYVREALAGFGEDNGNGTFYGNEEVTDDTGASWTYALHFERKYFKGSHDIGWTEDAWHPVTDGGIELEETST